MVRLRRGVPRPTRRGRREKESGGGRSGRRRGVERRKARLGREEEVEDRGKEEERSGRNAGGERGRRFLPHADAGSSERRVVVQEREEGERERRGRRRRTATTQLTLHATRRRPAVRRAADDDEHGRAKQSNGNGRKGRREHTLLLLRIARLTTGIDGQTAVLVPPLLFLGSSAEALPPFDVRELSEEGAEPGEERTVLDVDGKGRRKGGERGSLHQSESERRCTDDERRNPRVSERG